MCGATSCPHNQITKHGARLTARALVGEYLVRISKGDHMSTNARMSRRTFVAGAATAALASGSALALANEKASAAADAPAWDEEVDVVVVGMGAAGCAAAIEANAAGASVCVIEKAGRGGGSTFRSGGIIYMGGGTGLQKRLGIEDTPEDMAAYVKAALGPSSDPDLQKIFCDSSLDLYDWCEAQGMVFDGDAEVETHIVEATEGISLHYTGNERAPEYTAVAKAAPRGHTPNGGAAGIFEPMESVVEGFTTPHYNTAAESLVTDETGSVIGVRATDADGKALAVKANKGVVIAAGAFTYNDAMIADYNADYLLCGSKTGNENDLGDGIRMGQKVGAATKSMSRIAALEFMYLYGDLAAGAMLDYHGFRFLAEDWYGSWIGREVMERTPDACFVILDQPKLDNILTTQYGAYLKPYAQADSIEELAEAIGLPVDHVVESIERYNEMCAKGEDTDFHKSLEYLKAIETGPFYAMYTTPVMTSMFTLGGLKINTNAEVVNYDNEPIPGLYAAGRSSNGIYGEYIGSGSSIADCLTFGRIAGRSAAARA